MFCPGLSPCKILNILQTLQQLRWKLVFSNSESTAIDAVTSVWFLAAEGQGITPARLLCEAQWGAVKAASVRVLKYHETSRCMKCFSILFSPAYTNCEFQCWLFHIASGRDRPTTHMSAVWENRENLQTMTSQLLGPFLSKYWLFTLSMERICEWNSLECIFRYFFHPTAVNIWKNFIMVRL